MKKVVTLLVVAMASTFLANAKITLNGKSCSVDTILHRQIGPGVVQTIVRVPEYPLNAYVLEMDMNNEYNRVETTQANNTLGKQEYLVNAYKRHQGYGKKPLAACNASFWVVSGTGKPYTDFMMGVPFGGVVVNDTLYTNTNDAAIDGWNGGGGYTGSAIVDKNNKVHVGRHMWYGCVKSSKFSADQSIIQVNKRCNTGQLALFNHAVGRSHTFYAVADCHYIYLNFKAGEKWAIAKDVKFEVAEIKLSANNQVLGNYDACLVADGDYKAEMAKLAVGDEVVLNNYWYTADGDGTPIAVENMVEGNAYVMLNDELTARNTNETYNSQIYSRTAYGTNADGSKLYMIVIDKATHPVYGTSAGCSTTVMCNLLKYLVPDVWNVANFDAGGSAQMLVSGKVINKTTEASPRAVANGMMMFSTAPVDGNDVITSIAFEHPHMKSPICNRYEPNVLGYNKYGELISENVPVVYTCSENVGIISEDGKAVEVGSTPGYGTITAKYNGVEVTASIEVINSEFAIRVKPMILIDNKREYPIEISTIIGLDTIAYDPAQFTWEIEDETVATIENGVLRGLAEGTTKIKCTLGKYSDETSVKVEMIPAYVVNQDWNGWTVTSTNLSAVAVLSADGVLSFGYSGKRKATITLEKDIMIYSLPDSVILEVTTTTPLNDLTVGVSTALLPKTNEVIFAEGVGLPIGTHRWDLMDCLGGSEDIANYPVNISKLLYNISSKSGYVNGENTISTKLYSVYNGYTSGVEAVNGVAKSVNIYPQNGNFVVSGSGIDEVIVEVYNISGVMNYRKVLTINGGSAVVSPNLANGMYIIKVIGGGDTAVCKMVVND
ncbi:MAG: phosphodiester glycosidase family protein [Muribaculaceae bacterium]|nr:phosphodiester glycosidase family protein [Muribaculaceae bacterium]